jgi:hemerythrin superfamily protein
MSEKSIVTNESQNHPENHFSEVSITELLQEIQQTPREYWSNLLEIIRLFRESVTLKLDLSGNSEQETQETDRLTQQHKALSKLTKEWIEEGDEQEQTETWQYLRQALDENRLSNRPLFP